MVGVQYLSVALAVGTAVAYPGQAWIKRQQQGLGALLSAVGSGSLGKFMGEPQATEALIQFAKMMGANKNSPGTIENYSKNTMNRGAGIVANPPNAAPRRVVMKSRSGIPGAETIKIRYGPYKVPNMKKKNMLGEAGMLSNFPHTNMAKPCDGNCTVIGMNAGLEYPDGKNANIDSGMWLHHMVLFNVGPGREDPTCSQRDVSLPHATIGGTPRNSERIFASGNERTVGIIPEWGHKDVGYKIKSTDKFAALVELMNETPQDQVVYMTMTYDIVQGYPYKDDIKIIWFDVRQCGTSEVNPPKNQNKFVLDYKWTSSIEGEVVGAIGHLHDGGTSLTLSVDGKVTCTNPAKYGTKPEFIQKSAQGHHANGATTHISDMPPCHGSAFPNKTIRKGQNWALKAYYDFNQFKGMKHEDGAWDEVMGISIMFVRRKAASK